MMRRWNLILSSLAGLLLLGTMAAGQEAAPAAPAAPAAATPSKEIEALITQLSSPDQKMREEAQEKLLGMGDEAVAALQAHVRAKAAAEEALLKIDTNRVASPTLISLEIKDASALDALAELAKKSGYDLKPENQSWFQQGNLTSVSVTITKQPFWAALRELCAKANLAIYNAGYTPDRSLRFVPAQQGGSDYLKYPASLNGAFMVIISSLQRTHMADLAHLPNVNRQLSMQLQVFAEPKVKIVQTGYVAEIEEAVDEKGNSLSSASANPGRFGRQLNAQRGISWNVNVPLTYPANAGEKIAKLRGKLRLMAQTRSETLEIPDITNAKDVTKTIGGRRITFKDLRKLGDRQYEATLIVYRDGMDPQQFQELMMNPTIRLLDSQGQEFTVNGRFGGGGGEDQLETRLRFSARPGAMANTGIVQRPRACRAGAATAPAPANNPAAGGESEPAKLVWEIPTGTQELTVPFEFADLPLP